jgi:hypothetical protein
MSEETGTTDPGLVVAERDRLARMLRETRMQLTMTQARLAALEQSSTLELGRTIVRAARRPWSRGAQLPRDLYRMWRTGGAGQTAVSSPAMLALASAQLGDLAGGGERLLSALTAPGLASHPGPGLAITGVLTRNACAALAADAAVQPLLHHDADMLLESSGADLVLIEAAALLAGSPWAYAVDPAGADRGRRLARVIAAARTLGKPVILIRNVQPHQAPGLGWVADSCDAVSDEDLGVPLARFRPAGLFRAPGTAAPPDWPQVLEGLRDIFEHRATAARLSRLARTAGLQANAVTGRQIAVQAGTVPASLLGQRFLPAELVLPAAPDPAGSDAAVAAQLAARGVRISTRGPRAPWVVPWNAAADYPDTYLLDLACARECSQADAIGFAGSTYAFTAQLVPALARRDLIGASKILDTTDGLRLFSVS